MTVKEKSNSITSHVIIENLGGFESNDLDPAYLPEIMQPWKTAKKWFTPEDDGIVKDWGNKNNVIWLNPPILFQKGYTLFDWCKKMANHGNGIMLINADTGKSHFQKFVFEKADAILWLKGAQNMYDINGKIKGINNNSCLVAYGEHNIIRLKRSRLNGILDYLR